MRTRKTNPEVLKHTPQPEPTGETAYLTPKGLAMLREKFPNLSPAEAEYLLERTARLGTPPIPLATMRECIHANALACLAELRGAALAVLASSSPNPDRLTRLAKACEACAWVDA